MVKSTTELVIETALISALNITAAYVAAFTYGLSWTGVLTVMVVASLITGAITNMIVMKSLPSKSKTGAIIGDGVGVFIVGIIAGLTTLVILARRFGFARGLGIAFASGILSSFVRHILSVF